MYITLLTILQAEGGNTYAFIKILKMFIFDHHKEIDKIVHPRVSVQQVEMRKFFFIEKILSIKI